MASIVAKKAAGTYIEDSCSRLPAVLAWASQECRQGSLAESVRKFLSVQPEMVDPLLVVVESLTAEGLQCRVCCRCFDHEADQPFDTDIQFLMNPLTGICQRF